MVPHAKLAKVLLPDGTEERYGHDAVDNLREAPGLEASYRIAGATLGGLDDNPSAGSADLFVVRHDSSGVKQ
jgi:hypothetical protein